MKRSTRHLASGATIINDNWADLPNKSIPNGFAPQATESVIIADLVPGDYTVIERGAHGETGLGLTEIYDMNDTPPRNSVISARAASSARATTF